MFSIIYRFYTVVFSVVGRDRGPEFVFESDPLVGGFLELQQVAPAGDVPLDRPDVDPLLLLLG